MGSAGLVWVAMLLSLLPTGCSFANQYLIGVYYYPGWSAGNGGAFTADPWQAIRKYPERKPLLGWYDDGQQEIVEKQLQWMHQAGIGFVAFDWYWREGRPAPEASVRAYLRARSREKVKYALLWANHFHQANAGREWDHMVAYWLDHHLRNAEYLRVDDKPVVFVFSGDFLRNNAVNAGTTAKQLMASAQRKARAAGLKGIYFVLATPALEFWVSAFAPDTGFSALTAYNYHRAYGGAPANATGVSRSFEELDAAYRSEWRWIVGNGSLPYIVPMTSGWDSRPWGGSKDDPLHDQSRGTLDAFETHLRAGKSLMTAYPDKTKRMGVICCWNEFGEGSYIEPTTQEGFGYLERIRKVFVEEQ